MSARSGSYLVQILVPKEASSGEPVGQKWFDGLLKELTDKFGGVTSFIRAPGEGLWRTGGETQRDNIAVVEVMVKDIDRAFWHSLRQRIERDLGQSEIITRAQEIIVL
jgi:hypothetical protein